MLTALGVGFGGTDGTLVEGSTAAIATHEISLTDVPIAPVNITMSSPDGQILINGATQATLIFTESNYQQAQSVSIIANDDTVAEGNHTGTLTHTVSSADPAYSNSTFTDRTLNITDNETTTLTEAGSLSISEAGATSVYSISLSAEPTADVTVTLTADAQSTIDGVTTKSFTFSAANWNIAQTFTAAAVDDGAFEAVPTHPSTVTVSYASASGGYASAPNTTITFVVTENDIPM